MAKRLVVGIILLVLGIAAFLSTKEEPIQQALKHCSGQTPQEFNSPCFRGALGGEMTPETLRSLMDALERAYERNGGRGTYGLATCHLPAHIMGEEAIAAGVTFPNAVTACSTACDYGCIHGAFIASIRDEDDFLNTFTSLCDPILSSPIPKDSVSCSHVVGHGLAELLGSDVSLGVTHCSQFSTTEARESCAGGVLMQYLYGSPDVPPQFLGTSDELLTFCDGLPSPYGELCWRNVGEYGHHLFGRMVASGVCGDVPSAYRGDCFMSVGVGAYLDFGDDAGATKAFCESLGSDVSFACIIGAMSNAIDSHPTSTYPMALCTQMDGVKVGDCFSFLGARTAWAYGEARRKEVCKGVSEAYRTNCAVPSPTP
jgi:hypothetical protein